MVVVAQLVRAPVCGSGGRGFESHLPPKKLRFTVTVNLFLYPSVNLHIQNGKKEVFLDLFFLFLLLTHSHMSNSLKSNQ